MVAVGIVLAVLVDLLIPAVLVALLVRDNRRGRGSDRGERLFWAWFGPIIGVYALAVIVGLPRIWAYDGWGVIVATVFAIPAGLVPALFNSTVIHYFFTVSQWGDFGYFAVTAVYTMGLIAWAALPPLAIRRRVQSARAGGAADARGGSGEHPEPPVRLGA